MSFIEKFEKLYDQPLGEIFYTIPEIQREVEKNNIEKIENFQLEYYKLHNTLCLNHSISIAQDTLTGIDYLLDGQHRIHAYRNIKKKFPEISIRLTVDKYYCSGKKNIEKTYEYINTHMRNDITILGVDEYKIYQIFEKLMKKEFKTFLKDSDRPVRPNINIQKVKDYMKEVDLIKNACIKSGEELFQICCELNNFYSKISSEKYDKWSVKDSEKILNKLSYYEEGLYLGLYSGMEWVDRIIDHRKNNICFDKLEHISKTYRVKITKNLREAVWDKRNNISMEGICYCCGSKIKFTDFECGHIVPVSMRGGTVLKNLEPICSDCNSDMRTMNLEEYKNLLNKQLNSD